MRVIKSPMTGILVLCTLLIASCDETGSIGKKSFKSEYGIARTALEKGDFAKSNRLYKRLLPDAGALTPRIKLELSHSLLRSGDFATASKLAGDLVQTQRDDSRTAALSVQATAIHEMGLRALAEGDTKTGKRHLEKAEAALTEVLETNPGLDPLGGMAGRRASIQSRLSGLR